MAPITIASLEEDDPERPDVGLEPNLDPRLGRLGQDAVLVLVRVRSVNVYRYSNANLPSYKITLKTFFFG